MRCRLSLGTVLLIVLTLPVLASANLRDRAPVSNFDEAFRAVSANRFSTEDLTAFEKWYGESNLQKGVNPKQDDLRSIFAVSVPGASGDVTAESVDGSWKLKLKHLKGSDAYASTATFPDVTGFRWNYHSGTQVIGGGDFEAYQYPPETKSQPNVPKGTLTQMEDWRSKIFAGTNRHWWTYVPAQYDPSKPACLYVVQDGQWTRGYWPTVLDNMIAQKEIPVTIAVFITPGIIKTEWDDRSVEYDTVSDKYPSMLADEILPEIYNRYNIRKGPASHLIAGLSSSGISSFNAAWYRPEVFGKVLSWIGSFTNLQGGPTGVAGGNTYPAIIRDRRGWDQKGEPKPIRVFLQDGSNDLDNKAGNWPLSNQQMSKALQYGGYDSRFMLGHGFHSDKYGRALLPESLKWLFRDEPLDN